MKNLSLAAATVLAVSGCASQAIDNSPKVTGAVVKTEFAVNGQILPDFTGVQSVYTVADKRAIRDTVKFDNFLMRWANYDEADISRLDLNKAYKVNYKSEKYSECSLDGCSEISFLEQFEPPEGDDSGAEEEYMDYDDLGCTVSLVRNDFDVTQTGQRRKLNGFDVDQYTVLWEVEYQDASGGKDLNQISFDFWTTQTNPEINNVWAVHQQFQDGVARQVKNDPLVNLLGESGYKALAAFTGDLDSNTNPVSGEIGEKLAKVEGYPISIKFEWVRDSKACQQEKEAASSQLELSGGLESMGKQLLGNLAKKGTDKLTANWQSEPLVRYVYEIKSVALQDFSERVFNVPAGYSIEDRR